MVIQIKSRLPMAAPVRMEQPVGDDLSWLEVDLGRVEHNARAVRGLLDGGPAGAEDDGSGRAAPAPAGRVKLCPVLKKDGYGLGAVTLAHRLARAGCADLFAVYSPDEAERLVSGAVTTPILVLMPMRSLSRTDGLYRHAVAEKLHLSIHDPRQLDEINTVGQQLGIKFPCHLYVDTGMSRSGLSVDQARALLGSTTAHRYVRIAGVFTHFASSETDPAFTARQRDAFVGLLDAAGDTLPEGCIRHAASSAALLRDPTLHFDMARPGIAMLGYADTDAATLRPAMRWCSRVVHTQRYAKDTPVSYGCTHTLERDAVLGIVPVGHGDGYPVALSNRATVRVNHTDCRVLGQVSMDQIVVDLTDAAHDPIAGVPADPATLMGREVEVYSNDPDAANALPRLAELAGTNVYELLCRLSPTLTRKYLQSWSLSETPGGMGVPPP